MSEGVLDVGLNSDFEINGETLNRWNSRFGETVEQYLAAARKARPELGHKKIRISIGPSNEIEFHSEGQSVTHLVWPEIEKIRNEKIPRVPVVAGIYNAANAPSGRIQIEQKGKTATISSNLANGGRADFKGEYQQVTWPNGSKAMGFWGEFKLTYADGASRIGKMLIRVVLGDQRRVEIEEWFNQADGNVEYNRSSNHASRDEKGKVIAGPRF